MGKCYAWSHKQEWVVEMSRVAKNPVVLPKGVEVSVDGNLFTARGPKGILSLKVSPEISVIVDGNVITLGMDKASKKANVLSGTTRANIANMVNGVSSGYERKLSMVGVGYRAQVKDGLLNISLGFSHPIEFKAPLGIVLETPTQTEILVKGCDKQVVGQVAANIRAYRPPEPYKGKGVRYADEVIVKKEAKKK